MKSAGKQHRPEIYSSYVAEVVFESLKDFYFSNLQEIQLSDNFKNDLLMSDHFQTQDLQLSSVGYLSNNARRIKEVSDIDITNEVSVFELKVSLKISDSSNLYLLILSQNSQCIMKTFVIIAILV